MGKRKERRMAAMSNAGRRVKLDLFAEPSGDLGGSSAKDKDNEIGDLEHLDGLPKSPSSSGHQSVNPLLLLGQYSDEETEQGSGKSSIDGPDRSLLVDSKDKVEESSGPGEPCDAVEANADNNLTPLKVGELDGIDSNCLGDPQKLGGTDVKDANFSMPKEADPGEAPLLASGAEAQVVGDVNSGWKLVMHEETNQYYYWNTETGETSWEAPDVLVQTGLPVSHEYSTTQYNGVESNLDSTFTNGVMNYHSFPANALYENNESVGEGPHTQRLVEDRKCVHCGRDVDKEVEGYESGGSSWADTLISQCEDLLERLKSLQSANGILQGQDWVASHMLELEIRRSDLKSLSSCGSSLHPFWLYSQTQLKRLELTIDCQISKSDKSNSSIRVEDANGKLPIGIGKLECSKGPEQSVENRGKEASPGMENVPCEILSVKAGVSTEAGCHNDEEDSDSSSKQSDIGLEEGELTENAVHPHASSPTSPQYGEDIDMDVDMEVEDVISAGGVILPPTEPLPVAADGFSTVPPPPDDEWIPPPPPEAEQIPPPPPPDEPPEPSYHSLPCTEVGQPFSYVDYTVSYNYPHGDVASTNFYVHAGGGQAVQPDASISYGAVPITYGDTVHIPVNSVGPVVYYGLHDGAAQSVDVVMPVESTQLQLHSGPLGNSSLVTNQGGSSSTLPEVGSKSSLDNSSSNCKTEKKDSVPLPTSFARTNVSTSERDSTSVSLANRDASAIAATTIATSTEAKKVSRSKKRTAAVAPILRSNKKVSSLVDKWKAAKEQLQEDEEDEAKTALTILEKKRQREIEEWRAQQISSGEAKDNANFQPLGSDWRERVKRKRAQTTGKVVETKEPESTGNQRPDLVKISKQLPSGWQAYWDESSKQVYYGNEITSETSWTTPTA